ncbi:unnamed protein product [Brassicogethes aeneus]|uniref:Uncharacterized protein n=1 Tax=Brassicogethes aeneus TaxID=1431903 RepID=A0A9P0FMC5_BRAAE|nr:unnamed protein product [Brassicogethes aeneus]
MASPDANTFFKQIGCNELQSFVGVGNLTPEQTELLKIADKQQIRSSSCNSELYQRSSNFSEIDILNPSIIIASPNTSEVFSNQFEDNLDPPPQKRKKKALLSNFNLKEILQKDAVGNAIYVSYLGKQEPLDTRSQGYFCDVIITYFLNKSDSRLTNEEIQFVTERIVELFPHEIQETYFVPPIRKFQSGDSKAGISKGKLIDKYRNKL